MLFPAFLIWKTGEPLHGTPHRGNNISLVSPGWLKCHVHMFEWFGCAVPVIVCDNLKTGVTARPRDGEVVLNEAYRALAAHYSSAVIPGRVRHPKDKPSAENEVWQATKAIVGGLRDAAFASLDELNGHIAMWLNEYIDEPFQKRDGSRRSVFESEERPLMIPLPEIRYEVCMWECGRKVQPNCRVQYQATGIPRPPTPSAARSI